ncbi:MAG: SCP2 sterol-binding domain-containing protein, partial [Candidatus Binatia bacterium]
VANESIDVKPGKHPSPNITLAMKESDYLDMINGKLNGQVAFMTGKLKIAGDMGLALKLQSLFKQPAAGGPAATSTQQVMDKMPENFNTDAAKGMNAVYQFDLTD